jgi:hypothetical protein
MKGGDGIHAILWTDEHPDRLLHAMGPSWLVFSVNLCWSFESGEVQTEGLRVVACEAKGR